MARHRLVETFFIRLSVWSPKTFVSPSTTAPKNELICPSRAGSSMAKICNGLLVCDVGMFWPERNQNERFSVQAPFKRME
jgi:hypothetical protein